MDIWSILIFITLAHGIFTLGLLLLKSDKSADAPLIFLILVLLWIQAEFLAIRSTYDMGVELFYGTRHGSWLIIGPLLYSYVQGLTGSRAGISAGRWMNYVPFFVFALFIPLLSPEELTFRQIHYGMLTVFDYRGDAQTLFQWLYSTVFILQFVHLGFYLALAYRDIRWYEVNLKTEFSSIQTDEIRWLKFFLTGIAFILISASIFMVILFYTEIYRRHMDYIYIIPVSLLMYVVSYRLAGVKWEKYSEVIREKDLKKPREDDHREKYQHSTLTDAKAAEYEKEIKQFMKSERAYLDNDLKLGDLSDALQIPSHQLSELLNQYMDTSFFDFINRYRIAESKRRIEKNEDETLLHIAFDSGFNNKTSFINAFKKFEGITPSQFKKSVINFKNRSI